MESNQTKSILIRHRDDDDEPDRDDQPTKIQRLESPGVAVPATKIIDLNDRCLVKIFEHLDLESLFNVAVANESLRLAAVEMYKQKFGAMTVEISDCHKESCELIELQQCSKLVKICGLKTCLQFLRCFGSSIDYLMLDHDESDSKRYQYVYQYINSYCAESLIGIAYVSMPNISIEEHCQKAFSNVKKVEFWFSDLGQQLPSIAKCFPKVQNLTLVHNEYCEEADLIQESLLHLKEIFINASNGFRSAKTVKNLLQMASQLKCLEIYTDDMFPMNALLDWIKFDPRISKLFVKEWDLKETIDVDSDEVQQLITEHPALVELDLYNYQFNVDDAITMIRELSSLKQFRFRMNLSDYTYFVNQLGLVWEADYITMDDDNDDDDSEDGSYDSDEDIILVMLNR